VRIFASACLALVLVTGLISCTEEEVAELPPPAVLTHEAIGYYCNMTVMDHHGPKGQIRLKSRNKPIWFSSVRDTVAFTLLPEEPKDILAIYVTDMSKAESWENPEAGNWIDAKTALFVTGSSRKGGMGATEPVPFASEEAAEKFAKHHGGKIVAFSDIPHGSVLGPVEIKNNHENMEHPR
jgi:copper chaperone NosL